MAKLTPEEEAARRREANQSVARSYRLRTSSGAPAETRKKKASTPLPLSPSEHPICIRHPEYRGVQEPALSCKTCCQLFLTGLNKQKEQEKPK